MPKDGMPKIIPDLSAPRVWVMNYQIRLNGVNVTRELLVERGARREQAREVVGQAMALDLAHVLEEMFGD
jgi:hypothetical protein